MRTTVNSVNRLTRHSKTVTGYADVQASYIDAGWTPLPLPRGQKMPPPKGYTGEGRAIPTARILKHWADSQPGGNVALVMPQDVIGIDVDIYGDKHGGETFRKLLSRYSSLPNAPYSTSRSGTEHGIPGGIHFYRVPPCVKWVRGVGSGIDVIQPSHRYAVTWPSIHPEGRQYQWYAADRARAGIPSVDDLPELPEAWVKGLSMKSGNHTATGFAGDTLDWYDSLPETHVLPLDRKIKFNRAIRAITSGEGLIEGSRYATMTAMQAKLVGWGAYGYRVRKLVDDLFTAYVAAVDGERHAESEFDRALDGAVSKFGAK